MHFNYGLDWYHRQPFARRKQEPREILQSCGFFGNKTWQYLLSRW